MVKQTKRILFVEDVFASIAAIWDIIVAEHCEWMPVLRSNVPDAWRYLCCQPVDAAVIDVMLPAVEGVPPWTEGWYLAAWVRQIPRYTPPELLTPTPAGDVLQMWGRMPLALLTARTLTGLRDEEHLPPLNVVQQDSREERSTRGSNAIRFFAKAETDALDVIEWLTATLSD
ncbi:MAG TPA: hypothetical protein PKK06_00145 [Phycisphaerae bacterium]|nr:hypothetical protein [Phycisphaerae bacterium]HNU43979.1 hypothetical protein [Phycisphaerae bacterium]